MKHFIKPLLMTLLGGVTVLGCSSADESALEPPASTAAAVMVSTRSDNATDTKAAKQGLADQAPKTASVVKFTPPFPQRVDLFEPPQRAQSTVRRDGEHGETIELKGFIFVDEPLVVLSIDGVVSSIPQGGEKYGVQVISIEPPTVVLQRGRNRWPATLE
jgi:hypothetical protein